MSRDNALSWDLDSPDNEIASNSRRDSTSPHYKGAPLSPSASDGDHSKERHRRRSARALVGLDEFAPPKRHYSGAEKLLWSRIRQTLQEPFAEFLGVMVLSCFYNGSIAQSLLSAGLQTAPGGSGYGTFMSVPWGTGIGVMLGIYISGDSGAYLNPAITLTACVFRGLPWKSFPSIVLAQFLGAFVATALVYGNYISAIDWYAGPGNRIVPPETKATAQIMATYPQTFVPRSSQVFSVIIPSALITTVVSALKDDYNNGISRAGGNFFPLAMFFLFYGIGVAFGWETGGATNPALDFSGRLFSSAVGYPREVWTTGGYYFWIPLLMPFVGAIAGSFLYDTLVFTGPSPINSPWLGLKRFIDRSIQNENSRERVEARRDKTTDQV
ncbi:Major intrinsic protein [Lasiodiplodia theobromae]|uniref:Putative membrane protein n=1 Tax=Lasiodiplodia theobromae TaxID=45133 RepID=A0A5N5DD01_9PEZI|nr:putative membrane protein [Lasiodiplodia theobromae]KAF9636158.1 Major intrinsic protein [Lasiodiplodia theobromae]